MPPRIPIRRFTTLLAGGGLLLSACGGLGASATEAGLRAFAAI